MTSGRAQNWRVFSSTNISFSRINGFTKSQNMSKYLPEFHQSTFTHTWFIKSLFIVTSQNLLPNQTAQLGDTFYYTSEKLLYSCYLENLDNSHKINYLTTYFKRKITDSNLTVKHRDICSFTQGKVFILHFLLLINCKLTI